MLYASTSFGGSPSLGTNLGRSSSILNRLSSSKSDPTTLIPITFCFFVSACHDRFDHIPCTSSYLVDFHEYEQIVALEIDLVTFANGRCDSFDDFISRELFIVPYGRPDRELQSELC